MSSGPVRSAAAVVTACAVAKPADLRSQAAELARRTATERETPQALGLAVWGGTYVLMLAGAVDLAHAELDAVTVPTTIPESTQLAGLLAGLLALCQPFLTMLLGRVDDVHAPAFDHVGHQPVRPGGGGVPQLVPVDRLVEVS